MRSSLVYSDEYDFGVLGLERLHPFDAKKFSKAWQVLQQRCGDALHRKTWLVEHAISDAQLALVHTPEYLQSLADSASIAQVVELAALKFVPAAMLRRGLVNPARFAAAGTVEAARQALDGATVFNMGGASTTPLPTTARASASSPTPRWR